MPIQHQFQQAPWSTTQPLPAPWASEPQMQEPPWQIEVREQSQRQPISSRDAHRDAVELFSMLEEKHGLPQGLLDAVWEAESGRGKNMRSSTGAQGHFQFMPGTAKTYGLSDPYDLHQSADAAARYYANLSRRFGGDVPKMLAGYNWGEGNVEKKGMGNLPEETRGYISKITSMMGRGAKSVGDFFIPTAQANEEPERDPWAQFKEATDDGPTAEEQATTVSTEFSPEDWTRFKEVPAEDSVGKIKDMLPPVVEKNGNGQGYLRRIGEVLSSAMPSGVVDTGVGSLAGLAGIAGNVEGLGESLYNGVHGNGWNMAPVRRNVEYIDQAASNLGVDTENSIPYDAGRLASSVIGTLGVGPMAAYGAKSIPILAKKAPGLVTALETSGMSSGPSAVSALGRAGNALSRVAGGAATGALSAGIVNPDESGTGAAIGAAIPGAGSIIGGIGKYAGSKALGAGKPEVISLANRAKQLGIEIPLDRIYDSKPLNALASGLDYVPFSGRNSVIEKMENSGKKAITRTFGQDSTNIKVALEDAKKDLGEKFDATLKNNSIKITPKFEESITKIADEAKKNLVPAEAKLIQNQIDDIMDKYVKFGGGQYIDGQAAYNIKRTLDKISKRSSNEANSASDLRSALMDALNESLGPEKAAEFAKVRSQYSNMKEVEKLAQNGAEGDISWARVGNMKNAKSPELKEIANISYQFMKAREGQHGASQRAAAAMLGWGAAGGSLLGLVGPTVVGRAINGALNSNELKRIASGLPKQEANILRQISFKARKAITALPSVVAYDNNK
jgi:hypothetical protein